MKLRKMECITHLPPSIAEAERISINLHRALWEVGIKYLDEVDFERILARVYGFEDWDSFKKAIGE